MLETKSKLNMFNNKSQRADTFLVDIDELMSKESYWTTS